MERLTRAYMVQLIRVIAMIRLMVPVPRTLTIAMTKTMCGKASSISVIRIRTVSTIPPVKPEIMPMIVPMTAIRPVTAMAISRELFPP